jgi:alcohol-forming fatty acyl-CoA reductase
MSKISPVYGEISKPNFDLSEEHLEKVVENTEIVFHLAASLNMAVSLKTNVIFNLIGTKNALELAKKMKKLVQMVHLSTAFCNVEPEVVYEKVYELPHDPDDLIRMAEWMDNKAMEAMQKELLGQHPNTYTYTKRLAEILVQREYGRLPVCIVRPSIVLPSIEEPFPGWVDSLNGFPGVMLAAGKGVLRSMLIDPEGIIEVFPVDLSINIMLLIAKVLSTEERSEEIPVFHLTAYEKFRFQYGWLVNKIKEYRFKYPLSISLW